MSNDATTQPRYRLADHVRACLIDEQVILLDLNRNRYLGLGGEGLNMLAQSVKDWPMTSLCSSLEDESVIASILAPLARQGMLASSAQPGPERPFWREPLQTLASEPMLATAAFEWRQLMRLWRCAAVASLWIHHRSLADIVRRVSQAKSLVRPDDATARVAVRAAAAAYMRVRPFAFSAHDRCLHDSLTLTLFLCAHRLLAQWVIGVRTHPFAAHSWVQSGDVVLNDLHENVRRFRPILVA